MIRIRRAMVKDVVERHPGLLELTVEIDGGPATALAYEGLTAPIEPGDFVVLNTTAVHLDLGTGGEHFVIAVEGKDAGDEPPARGMKLRYTPVQTAVLPVEEDEREAIDALEDLGGVPVIAAGLHSAVAPAAIGVRATLPAARIAYVMTDAGALPLALSRAVPAMRAAGLLDITITSGQAFGGDLEAIALPGALAAAVAVARADVIIVAMGPGNIGTGSRWGFGAIEVAAVLNTAGAMGGRAIVAPRLSFADARPRHQGVSHHTLTALSLTLTPTEIALPTLTTEREALVREQLVALPDHHHIRIVDVDDALLEAAPVELHSMGRGFADDPDYFRTATAAGILAARLLER